MRRWSSGAGIAAGRASWNGDANEGTKTVAEPRREHADAPAGAAAARGLRRGAALLILIFWIVHYGMLSLRAAIKPLGDPLTLGFRRFILASMGAALCYLIYLGLSRLSRRRFSLQALAGAGLAFLASGIHAAANNWAFSDLTPAPEVLSELPHFLYTTTYWFWFYFSWTTAFLALSYSLTVREQERRASALQAEAHGAQMRALRYQINPHFLFNTLNSIATLVAEDPKQAEQMVLNLSDFFRNSLAVDPTDDVRLADEIALQRLYLEIERVRFPNRLRFEVELPAELEGAMVPSLLLQPIVENAVKHGVARSEGVTTIRIAAARQGERLCLTVSEDGTPAASCAAANGTGVGLGNVRNRLAARYGGDHGFASGPLGSGYRTEIELPLRF